MHDERRKKQIDALWARFFAICEPTTGGGSRLPAGRYDEGKAIFREMAPLLRAAVGDAEAKEGDAQ